MAMSTATDYLDDLMQWALQNNLVRQHGTDRYLTAQGVELRQRGDAYGVALEALMPMLTPHTEAAFIPEHVSPALFDALPRVVKHEHGPSVLHIRTEGPGYTPAWLSQAALGIRLSDEGGGTFSFSDKHGKPIARAAAQHYGYCVYVGAERSRFALCTEPCQGARNPECVCVCKGVFHSEGYMREWTHVEGDLLILNETQGHYSLIYGTPPTSLSEQISAFYNPSNTAH